MYAAFAGIVGCGNRLGIYGLLCLYYLVTLHLQKELVSLPPYHISWLRGADMERTKSVTLQAAVASRKLSLQVGKGCSQCSAQQEECGFLPRGAATY